MSRANLPGPAALRGHRERASAAFLVAASFVPERNLRAHASGEYAPSGAALVAYKVHLRIPPHAWFLADELAAYGVAPDGSKLQKVAPTFTVPPEDAHEPCPEHCGGAE